MQVEIKRKLIFKYILVLFFQSSKFQAEKRTETMVALSKMFISAHQLRRKVISFLEYLLSHPHTISPVSVLAPHLVWILYSQTLFCCIPSWKSEATNFTILVLTSKDWEVVIVKLVQRRACPRGSDTHAQAVATVPSKAAADALHSPFNAVHLHTASPAHSAAPSSGVHCPPPLKQNVCQGIVMLNGFRGSVHITITTNTSTIWPAAKLAFLRCHINFWFVLMVCSVGAIIGLFVATTYAILFGVCVLSIR